MECPVSAEAWRLWVFSIAESLADLAVARRRKEAPRAVQIKSGT